MYPLQGDSDIPAVRVAGFFAFGGKIIKECLQSGPLGNCQELCRDGVVRQTREPVFFASVPRVVAGDLHSGYFEKGLVEIGLLGFL